MTNQLTPTQREVYDFLLDPEFSATAVNLASKLGYSTTSTVYDHIKAIRERGYDIGQSPDNEYVVLGDPEGDDGPLNHSAYSRQNYVSQQTITRKANEFMAELEREIKPMRSEVGPMIADGGMVVMDGNYDVIIPCADDHYGDLVHDDRGREIFNSDILTARINAKFDKTIDDIQVREQMGATIDTVHVLLIGDHVTNEAIYDGQPWELEDHIRAQLKKATATYWHQIQRLSKLYPSVLVTCAHGNHGEFRVKGSSQHANADDFLYDRLELLAHSHELENVTFLRSDRAGHINFPIRGGKYTGHVQHGNNVPTHIGTSSPLNKWKDHLLSHGFDIAFRGHYHEGREEPVHGKYVIEVPSFKDGGDYEAQLGVGGADPHGFTYGISDDAIPAWKDYIHF